MADLLDPPAPLPGYLLPYGDDRVTLEDIEEWRKEYEIWWESWYTKYRVPK